MSALPDPAEYTPHIRGCDSNWRSATGEFIDGAECPTCRAIRRVEGDGVYGWEDFVIVEAMYAAPGWRRLDTRTSPR